MKSLDKAIDILESFFHLDEEVSLSEIADVCGFDKSTVNRIVSTWAKRGYLSQSKKRGKYSLGTKFLDYSGLIKGRSGIRNIAIPHMMKLAKITKESVVLSILNGQFAAHAEVIPSDYPLKIVPVEGSKVHLFSTGTGKIFLANMSEKDLDDYFRSNVLEAHTPNTITDPDTLRNHLITVLNEGIAFDDEEDTAGVRNVAAGIRDAEGKVVAAVGILGPSVRLPLNRMNVIIPDVKECAENISRDLRHKKNHI